MYLEQIEKLSNLPALFANCLIAIEHNARQCCADYEMLANGSVHTHTHRNTGTVGSLWSQRRESAAKNDDSPNENLYGKP